MSKVSGRRKDKVQLILPGSPFGMDHKPRDVFDIMSVMGPDQLQRFLQEMRDRGINPDLEDIVQAYEEAEGSTMLADAWGYIEPGYINQQAHDEIARQTEEYLAKGGTITVIE